MEFRDLKKQYQILKPEIDKRIQEVLTNANFISGEQVKELEKKLADYVGVKHCITCGNGTDALSLVLMAWGITEEDAIFVPDFTFFSTAEVVAFENAHNVFVDVNKDTFNIDGEKLEQAIKLVIKEGKYKPKAIIAVDLFGLPADFNTIHEIAQKYGLLVLEDAAQGFGGRIGNQKSGSFGDAATTSFFPAKPLGCYGDGGAVFTNDDDLAALVKSYAIHGKGTDKYDNVRVGMNSRLDTVQAVVLIEKLRAFEEYELEKVNKVAMRYTEQLKDIVKTPVIPDGYYSSWAQYTITLENWRNRDEIQTLLKEKGIPSMVYYTRTMSSQSAFKDEYKEALDVSVANDLVNRVLSLPMHPYLENDEIDAIVKGLKDAIAMSNARESYESDLS